MIKYKLKFEKIDGNAVKINIFTPENRLINSCIEYYGDIYIAKNEYQAKRELVRRANESIKTLGKIPSRMKFRLEKFID